MVCPDGAIIAYASQPVNGTTNIWLIDQNGANPRPVTTEGTLNRFYWSPDARQIVFVSYRTTDWSTENGSLWLVDVSSGARRRIATGGLE
jgi:Tol biopolymer transport system component